MLTQVSVYLVNIVLPHFMFVAGTVFPFFTLEVLYLPFSMEVSVF